MHTQGNRSGGFAQHGGNLSELAARHPHAPTPYIDLSTGINPYAYPLPATDPAWLHRLADDAEINAAYAAAADYYRAHSAANIALASGMQPMMFAMAALRLKEHGVSTIAVLSPTYSEYARIWRSLGHTITNADGFEAMARADVAIMCNPNNPDGRSFTRPCLLQLAQTLKPRNGWLVVDESFQDLAPEHSLAPDLQPNIMLLRSTGKFFGLAGLRVSAAIAARPWVEHVRTSIGPWPVSTPACRLFPGMLQDTAWATLMRAQLQQEAAQWRELLKQYFTLLGHTALFTLVEVNDAARWHEHLAAAGILVRRFNDDPRRLRFGLPERTQLERIRNIFAGYTA